MANTNGNGDEREGEGINAPYVSWATLKNTVEKMGREGGVPSQVDRSYLSNLPGSTQTQLIGTMKWLGLIDSSMKPTSLLEELVEADEGERKELIGTLLQAKYPDATALPALATQQQLEQTFRILGVQGSTLRKAVAFFLGAAKFADMTLSPHFKTPRAVAPTGERKVRKARTTPIAPSGGATAGTPGAARSAHHPLIEGLILELPPPGAAFPQAKQDDWLELARVTFRMIYRATDTPARPQTPEEEAGDG